VTVSLTAAEGSTNGPVPLTAGSVPVAVHGRDLRLPDRHGRAEPGQLPVRGGGGRDHKAAPADTTIVQAVSVFEGGAAITSITGQTGANGTGTGSIAVPAGAVTGDRSVTITDGTNTVLEADSGALPKTGPGQEWATMLLVGSAFLLPGIGLLAMLPARRRRMAGFR
jgi:hypothetical protein